MKKTLCIIAGAVLAIAIYWLGFANGYYCCETKLDGTKIVVLSDEELIETYIQNEYGPEYYGKIFGHNTDEFIDYEVYDADGNLTNICTTNRNWLRNKYN